VNYRAAKLEGVKLSSAALHDHALHDLCAKSHASFASKTTRKQADALNKIFWRDSGWTSRFRILLLSPHMGCNEWSLVQYASATNWIAPLGPHLDPFGKEFLH